MLWILNCAQLCMTLFDLTCCIFTMYHPRMWVGNNFSSYACLCLSICLSVCVSFCATVQAITPQQLKLETSFSVYTHIFPISRSSLSTKVTELKLRSKEWNLIFCKTLLHTCVPFVRVSHTLSLAKAIPNAKAIAMSRPSGHFINIHETLI